jgi:formylglycine-generating enzyme required for sulfatase activity
VPKIFLSYRRNDNPFAVDWIDHGLSEQFGRESIVRDIDTFPLGRDFRVVIEREVNTCDILLAIIGDRWLDMRYTEGEKSGQRRIDDPADFVRLEIEAALQRDIPVIPVLVDRASIPREADLPESLRELVYRGAAEVWAGRDRQTHLDRLIAGINYLVEDEQTEPGKEQAVESTSTLPLTFTNNIGVEFVLIPAGTFMMGTPIEQLDAIAGGDQDYRNRIEHETPQHQVEISQPFYLGKYPVTQRQWEMVMGATPSRFKGDNLPVERVSWNDVQAFIKKLNEREGVDHYRLPSEAEWEYACRAGSTGLYSFGDDAARLGEYAWYKENSDEKTHPVGEKKPNTWGLYDMHGNVWEWVQDRYDENYYQNSLNVDPQGPNAGAFRVYRGGSWSAPALFARSAVRFASLPGVRIGYLGFRCAMSVPSK